MFRLQHSATARLGATLKSASQQKRTFFGLPEAGVRGAEFAKFEQEKAAHAARMRGCVLCCHLLIIIC